MTPGAVIKNSITRNDHISKTIGWNWSNFVPEYFLYEAILTFWMELFQIYANWHLENHVYSLAGPVLIQSAWNFVKMFVTM